VISITVGQQAARTAEVDFLDAKLLLATGPLHLARSTGAPLLPVFTVMDGAGRLVVHVERPLIAGDGDQGESYEAIAQDYAQRLAPYLLRYPDQWGRA
jgi:lauroyl/myristoyl acyltransferase